MPSSQTREIDLQLKVMIQKIKLEIELGHLDKLVSRLNSISQLCYASNATFLQLPPSNSIAKRKILWKLLQICKYFIYFKMHCSLNISSFYQRHLLEMKWVSQSIKVINSCTNPASILYNQTLQYIEMANTRWPNTSCPNFLSKSWSEKLKGVK